MAESRFGRAITRRGSLFGDALAIKAVVDRETSERVGAGGTFQVVGLEDDEGNDLTHLVDIVTLFHSVDKVRRAILATISERLQVELKIE
jgi:hypothetical protein